MQHKPSPAIFLEAAKRLVVKPEACVVIEDAVNGIQAAKNGGMKSVGLVTAFHTAKELESAEADLVIKSLFELNVEKLQALF